MIKITPEKNQTKIARDCLLAGAGLVAVGAAIAALRNPEALSTDSRNAARAEDCARSIMGILPERQWGLVLTQAAERANWTDEHIVDPFSRLDVIYRTPTLEGDHTGPSELTVRFLDTYRGTDTTVLFGSSGYGPHIIGFMGTLTVAGKACRTDVFPAKVTIADVSRIMRTAEDIIFRNGPGIPDLAANAA